jgi:hypothetical protein
MQQLKGDLQRHFQILMALPINGRVTVTATESLKMELKMLLGISKIFEKVSVPKLLEIYEKKGGSKKDIENFLRQ